MPPPCVRARRLLDGPAAFLAGERNQKRQLIDRLTTPGQLYTGYWRYEPRSTDSIQDPKGEPRIDDRGPLALRVEARNPDTGTVLATLFDPATPTRWWRLHGKVDEDGWGEHTLELRWPAADPLVDSTDEPVKPAPPANRGGLLGRPFGSRSRASTDDLAKPAQTAKVAADTGSGRFFATPDNVHLSLDELPITRDRRSGSNVNPARIHLEPADDAKLAAAVKAVSAAAAAAEAATVALVSKGQTYVGQWQVRASSRVMAARARAGVRQQGPLTVRFEGWRADTREVTIVLAAGGKESRRPGLLGRTPTGAVVIELMAPKPLAADRQPARWLSPREIDPLAPKAVVHLSVADGKLSGRFRPPDTTAGVWVEMTLESAAPKP